MATSISDESMKIPYGCKHLEGLASGNWSQAN